MYRPAQKLLFILFLFAISHAMEAQRPKVGLVLSGGGAKGLAHIGVLKAIDEAGLKVDYITGTSMGAIIGAMYAAGYSGVEIERISRSLNWSELLTGKPLYKNVSIESKDDYENYALEVYFEDFRPKPFTGLIEPQEIWLKFAEIFFPVYNIKNFHDFSIPFQCVATDLSTGKAIVLSQGDIVRAIRSSMAIPGVFSAVDYDDTKLVDGGIVRNFPVRDVVKMGADFVIGVNLFSGLAHSNDMRTALDVMYQITNYRDAEDLVKEKQICDLIVEPPLANYTAASFDAADTIINIGNKTGDDFLPLFMQLAETQANYGKDSSVCAHTLPELNKVVLKDIDYQGLKRSSLLLLKHNLNLRSGRAYSPVQINDAFRKAYSTGYYKNLHYEMVADDSAAVVLRCNVTENPQNSLKLGLSYHTFTNASLMLDYTLKNKVGERSLTEAKVSVSEMPGLKLRHLQYFTSKFNHYIEFGYQSNRFKIPIYDKASLQYQYSTIIVKPELNYGYIVNTGLETRFGVGYEHLSFSPSIAAKSVAKGSVENLYSKVEVRHNSLNRKFLPESGLLVEAFGFAGLNRNYSISGNPFGGNIDPATRDFFRFNAAFDGYIPVNRRVSVITKFNVAHSFNHQGLMFNKFMIGGSNSFIDYHIPFLGMNEGQKFVSSATIAQIGAQWRMYGDLYGLLRCNAGLFNYHDFSSLVQADFYSGAAATVAYYFSSMPLEFSLMYSPEIGKVYVNARIGFFF